MRIVATVRLEAHEAVVNVNVYTRRMAPTRWLTPSSMAVLSTRFLRWPVKTTSTSGNSSAVATSTVSTICGTCTHGIEPQLDFGISYGTKAMAKSTGYRKDRGEESTRGIDVVAEEPHVGEDRVVWEHLDAHARLEG